MCIRDSINTEATCALVVFAFGAKLPSVLPVITDFSAAHITAVSYTHLDVYKRQIPNRPAKTSLERHSKSTLSI